MPLPRDRVVVIGAGIGGLVAALELAHAGLEVTVLERAREPGGKMRAIPTEAGPVDGGPTVFTLRWVFEALFEAVGESLDAHLRLTPLGVLARHHWRGSPTLDLHADPERSREAVADFAGARAAREFDAFSARAARLFAAFRDPVMTNPDPRPLSVAAACLPRAGALLRDMAPLRSFAGLLSDSFSDPRLRQLFGRYATYVGGSPWLSPAILALVWDAEAQGVWRIEGGMHRLARVLETLCRQRGANFRYGAEVRRIERQDGRAAAVLLADGTRIATGSILFNGDSAALAAGLLGPAADRAVPARGRAQRSLSAWVWTFSAEPGEAPLAHHNVFFGGDDRAEFHDLFRLRRLAADPTLYLCAQDRDEPAPGDPAGRSERFQIIMNAPPEGDVLTPSEQEIQQCETKVFSRLQEAGVPIRVPEAENALTTPWDFDKLFPGSAGAIYGNAPHGSMATFRRPRARSALPGLYLAGGTVHPGPGVPMAALSGRQAAAAILSDRVSTSPSRRTAMPGGMSTGSPKTVSAASRSSAS